MKRFITGGGLSRGEWESYVPGLEYVDVQDRDEVTVTAAVVTIWNSNRPKASSATSAFWPIASSLCTAGQRRRTSLSSTPIKTGLFRTGGRGILARAGISEVATPDTRSGRDCHE
jgi:hypothetical protein